VRDGLQSREFNGGAHYKSRSGEFFFGGINGFNAFFPREIRDNTYIPPVVLTAFSKLNREVIFDKPISEVKEIQLSHSDYVFAFEFAALDYTAPEMNRYAYKMEGIDKEWIQTTADKRFATYTTLDPGTYVFRVIGSNNDGKWNPKGTAVKVVISPALYQTWTFRILAILGVVLFVFWFYQRHVKSVRLVTELRAAHDAQMSIMPQSDPILEGCDISGGCYPANEVGGDFFDYVWLNKERTKLGIAVGDVSGKAMTAAMTAIMSSGMVCAWDNGTHSIRDMMNRLNRVLHEKTERKMFTALCLAALDIKNMKLTFSNAGLNEPLLKTNGSVIALSGKGHKYPLGSVRSNGYEENQQKLNEGDVLVLYTDGIPEAKSNSRGFYGYDTLRTLLSQMDTSVLTASAIREKILQDVQNFSGSAQQYDDMTVVVVKINGNKV
jgi:hypothetical protein